MCRKWCLIYDSCWVHNDLTDLFTNPFSLSLSQRPPIAQVILLVDYLPYWEKMRVNKTTAIEENGDLNFSLTLTWFFRFRSVWEVRFEKLLERLHVAYIFICLQQLILVALVVDVTEHITNHLNDLYTHTLVVWIKRSLLQHFQCFGTRNIGNCTKGNQVWRDKS